MAKHGYYFVLAALLLLSQPSHADDADVRLLPGVKLSIDNPLEDILEPLDDWPEEALEPLDDWSEKALDPLDDWPEKALSPRKWRRGDGDDAIRRPAWHRHHDDDDDDDDDDD